MIVAMDQRMPKTGETTKVFVPNGNLNKQGITSEDLAILAVGTVGMGVLLMFGGKIVTTALLVSVTTVGSGTILWIKMPDKVEDIPLVSTLIKKLPISAEKKLWILEQNWKHKADDYELLIDLLVSIGVVMIFGTTITGLLSAGMTGLMVSGIFRVRKVMRRMAHKVKSEVLSVVP